MRNFKEFINDIVRKPPILFPLIALAHVLWLAGTIWSDWHEFLDFGWIQVLWLSVYVILWVGICDLRKWALIIYVILALSDLSLKLAAQKHAAYDLYASNLAGFDAIFSVIILIFYRKFRR